jgi:GDP-L-fucose synthase
MDLKDTSFAGRKVVVTGGGGFLGRAVVRKLREQGCHEIIAPRRLACDLTKGEMVRRLLDDARPDFLLHLAAAVEHLPGRGNAAASFSSNVLMSTHLIEAAAERGIEKMVCIGSASSYPAQAPVPLREEDLFTGLPEESRAAHGIAKRLPLIHAQACRKQYGLRCIFLIPTNLYGPDDDFDPETSYVIPSFVRKFVEAAESRAPKVILRGTGSATRDFLHVEDCSEAILLALARHEGEDAVNLGSGTEIRIEELAARIARLAGYTGRTLWNASYPDGPPRRLLDTTRAERTFGFRARRGLEDGLRETVAWYRAERSRNAPEQAAHALASSL